MDCYWQIKTGILLICSHVNTIAWLHHLDFDDTPQEKARCELRKDAAWCFEQILEAAPYKIAAVRPLTSHLEPSKWIE